MIIDPDDLVLGAKYIVRYRYRDYERKFISKLRAIKLNLDGAVEELEFKYGDFVIGGVEILDMQQVG